MRYAWRVRAFRCIPEHGVAELAGPTQVGGAQRCEWLSHFDADGSQIALEALTREDRDEMNAVCARVGCRNPGVARYEDDRARSRDAGPIANNDTCAAFFEDQQLLGVVVLVKGDGLAGCHRLCEDRKIFRLTHLTVDFDDERPTGGPAGAAHQIVPIVLL